MSAPGVFAVVVLAAGAGTRMRSALPKVLHGFAGRTMLQHVLTATQPLAAEHTLVVVGHGRDAVAKHLGEIAPGAVAVTQAEQHGTGHAVALALDALPAGARGTVVVVPGDAPLLTPTALAALVEQRADATLLTSMIEDPTGYGRVLRDGSGRVAAVVEHADATPEQRAVREIATSVYAFDHQALRAAIGHVGADNAQSEQYLPDTIGILVAAGRTVLACAAPATETAGVNDRAQLAAAHRIYNARLLDAHMRNGVTILDPGTTWVDADVAIEADATLLPSVELYGATTIATGAEVGPRTCLTDTTVGAGSRVHTTVAVRASIGARVTVGPFAYLRAGTTLADDAHIGTYVELKNSAIGAGSKVPHLSYVGDATIGEHTNIGAATVFVNYDGVGKHRTTVGDHARVGSDTMLIAPVEIGDGAYTAAGSVITDDVPPGALGVARGRQRNVAGWVTDKRAGTAAAEAAERAGAAPAVTEDFSDGGRHTVAPAGTTEHETEG